MGRNLVNEFKTIINEEFKVFHFIVSFILISSLRYVLLMSSIVLEWLCCMEPAASSSMFSNFTLFGIFTIDLVMLFTVLRFFYKSAKLKLMFSYCKSYIIIGLFLMITYFVILPWCLIINI